MVYVRCQGLRRALELLHERARRWTLTADETALFRLRAERDASGLSDVDWDLGRVGATELSEHLIMARLDRRLAARCNRGPAQEAGQAAACMLDGLFRSGGYVVGQEVIELELRGSLLAFLRGAA
jgi:hypothetical protein